nr:MAG: capsid protein [Cressdnaviricota sp.]
MPAKKGQGKYVLKRGTKQSRGKYVKKRRGSKKGRRSIRRATKTGNSLGVSAVLGGRSEEDAQVKRHVRYGVIQERGSVATTDGDHGLYVAHSTIPGRTFMVSVFMAMIKKIQDQINIPIGSWESNIDILASSSTPPISVRMNLIGDIAGVNSTVATVTVTLIGSNYYSLADGLATSFLSFSTANAQGIFKMEKFQLQYAGTGGTNPYTIAELQCDSMSFQVDSVSNLLYQNRTSGDDSSNVALDVTQNPLFEVQVTAKGSGLIPANYVSPVGSLMVVVTDMVNGIVQSTLGSSKTLISEPTKKMYTNVSHVKDVLANPGVVKMDKLKSSFKITWNTIMQKFKNFSSIDNEVHRMGHTRYLWFRKCIDLIGSTTVHVSFQHHLAIGVTCKYKKNARTFPYVSAIQAAL